MKFFQNSSWIRFKVEQSRTKLIFQVLCALTSIVIGFIISFKIQNHSFISIVNRIPQENPQNCKTTCPKATSVVQYNVTDEFMVCTPNSFDSSVMVPIDGFGVWSPSYFDDYRTFDQVIYNFTSVTIATAEDFQRLHRENKFLWNWKPVWQQNSTHMTLKRGRVCLSTGSDPCNVFVVDHWCAGDERALYPFAIRRSVNTYFQVKVRNGSYLTINGDSGRLWARSSVSVGFLMNSCGESICYDETDIGVITKIGLSLSYGSALFTVLLLLLKPIIGVRLSENKGDVKIEESKTSQIEITELDVVSKRG